MLALKKCMIFINCTLFVHFAAARISAAPIVSFQLVGTHAHCPRDAGTKEFLLGWGDRSCAKLAAIGPQLLTNSSSLDFRSWNLEVVSHRIVRLVTHPPSQGSMLCSGSLAVANVQSCQDDKVTIATSPVTDSSDEFVMVPVPKNVRTSTGEVYLVAKTRTKGCARFLSAVPGCHHDLLKLANRDDGSGLQRWLRTKVATHLYPAPAPAQALVPPPSTVPAPIISASAIGPSELMVKIVMAQDGCLVNHYVLQYSFPGHPTASIEIQPGSRPDLYHILSGLQPNTSYTLQATGVCSNGSSSLPSAPIFSKTLPKCLSSGDQCLINGDWGGCCEGTCISAGGPAGVCGYAQSLPIVTISFTVKDFTGSLVYFESQMHLYFANLLQLPLYQVKVMATASYGRRRSPSIYFQAQIYIQKLIQTTSFILAVSTNGSLSSQVTSASGGASLDAGSVTVVNTIAPSPVSPPPSTSFSRPCPAFPPPLPPAAGSIATFAGTGNCCFHGDNGPATSAALDRPTFVTLDTLGNLYIADTGNMRIRIVYTNGTIATIAGNGTGGFGGDNGPATGAMLYNPTGVALDTLGNLYIADTGNMLVRIVYTNGTIDTFAGNGNCCFHGDNGPATSAVLFEPIGVTLDTLGNLYIADNGNMRIRIVYTNGTIDTFAGNGTNGFGGDNGPATSAELFFPYGVALDSPGNLYIVDTANQRIRTVHVNGTIATIAGNGTGGFGGDNGPATSAELFFPSGAALDTLGNLYIADSSNDRIRIVYS